MSYKASTPFKIVSLFLTRSIPQFFILARPMINCIFFSNSVNSHCPITLQENEAEDPLNTSIVTFQLYRPWQTRTHCCGHIVADTNVSPFARARNICSGLQKMYLILFRNILCTQQMFPSLRSPRNIMGNYVSATRCPRLPGPYVALCCPMLPYVALCCLMLPNVAVCCRMLPCSPM